MYEKQRARLIDLLRDPSVDRPRILDERVLSVLSRVPRHCFVPPEYLSDAYEDEALPIGNGQTISQPFVVASMTEALELQPSHRVLEIGAGCGYQTAILAELAAEVFSIEFHAELARQATLRLDALGYQNIQIRHGDGFDGWPDCAPFDRIIVTCRAVSPPPPLLDQLSESDGVMVIPVGEDDFQMLKLYRRSGDFVASRDLYPVRFVPLLRDE